MAIRALPTRSQLLGLSLLALLLSAFVLYYWYTSTGIPERKSLAVATGQVEWVEYGKYGVHFRLAGSPVAFDYQSKGNSMHRVRDALQRHDRPQIRVLYDASNPHGPIHDRRRYHAVYEVYANNASVRSYAEVADAWAADTSLAPLLAGLLALSGVFLSIVASRLGA